MIRSNVFDSRTLVTRSIKWVAATICLMLFMAAIATAQESEGPTTNSLSSRLKQTEKQIKRSLESVKKIHDHPLYVMNYYGDYDCERPLISQNGEIDNRGEQWACSLFFASGNKDQPLYGRNFDWQNNPALLLFTDPKNGYASVSMVDVSYLGFARKDKKFDSVEGRKNLLTAAMIPFDGMNEHGLTVGMAAVPDTKTPNDKKKHTVGGLQIIRIMLDKAKTVKEAVDLIKKYNIQFSGGPQIHYMIADAAGDSAVVEMKDGKLNIIRTEKTWHSATNFHLTGNEDKGTRLCRRYSQIQTEMKNKKGKLTIEESFKLLKNVSQVSTRWSVVYDMKGKKAHIAMSRRYDKPLEYEIRDLSDSVKTSK